ncbi:MAG: DUF1553 domain-containing protein, partial [Lentisphaeraceae bacterium]|nr:DUF1553 domain-containing protein [Lentisphaeraceae bacterium]
LSPSPMAAKNTLIRRLSFDLRRLPPTKKELIEFTKDKSPQAYEKLVAKFLASPHYGEKMARHWLDLARYGDSAGFHGDQPLKIYPYRDYVINSFNKNKNFRDFTREQLGGDLIANATDEQHTATGFNRLNLVTREGGARAKEYLAKYATDRINTVATTWLGSTLACAECHDHKFDPFSAKDFYSFGAFFADIDEVGVYNRNKQGRIQHDGLPFHPLRLIPNATNKKEFDRITAELATLREEKTKSAKSPKEKIAREYQQVKNEKLKIVKFKAKSATKFKRLADNSLLMVSTKKPTSDVFSITMQVGRRALTALRLEVLTDKSIPKGLSFGNGNFVLNGIRIFTINKGKKKEIRIAKARADYAAKNFGIKQALNNSPENGWSVHGRDFVNCQAVFNLKNKIPASSQILIELSCNSKHSDHVMAHFRLSSGDKLRSYVFSSDEYTQMLKLKASAKLIQKIADNSGSNPQFIKEEKRLKKALANTHGGKIATQVTVAVEPRVMRILPRGNWMDDSGEIVQPAYPGFLNAQRSSESKKRLTRLDLAEWLCNKQNPLTARVFVNRLWKMYFGNGLSRLLNDFGSQGEAPVNSALLDALAWDFMSSNWDVKHMVKTIALSKTYQQSSKSTEMQRKKDLANRFSGRQSPTRLDAEFIRDNALSVSGLLNKEIGGASVKPYQPAGYWKDINFPARRYSHAKNKQQYRRGIYVHWQRSFLHPMMKAFDAPNRTTCTAERSISNTPIQALTLLNDPTFNDAAVALA